MPTESQLRGLVPLLELLLESGDAALRDRLFLEAVLASGAARGAALWRRTESGAWVATIWRGDPVLLPSRPVVEAVAQGRLRSELLPDRRVLLALQAGQALALGGLSPREEDLDAAEALHLAFVAVSLANEPGELWAAPFPSAARGDAPGEGRGLQHDLRNVLTSVRTTRDLLERHGQGLSPDEADHFRDVLDRECRRIGELLGRAAGADAGAWAVLGLVVRDVADAERALLSEAGIELVLALDPAIAGARVDLSESDLARLVRNLLVNAREALAASSSPGASPSGTTRSGERIGLALESADFERVRLRVEDDGPGIQPAALGRLFEPGFSAGKAGGSGQGLAIVAALARSAGGTARAWNRAAGGAAIEVVLPIARDRLPDHGRAS